MRSTHVILAVLLVTLPSVMCYDACMHSMCMSNEKIATVSCLLCRLQASMLSADLKLMLQPATVLDVMEFANFAWTIAACDVECKCLVDAVGPALLSLPGRW